jgi:ATP-dependent Clp protease ATP-binding subunit ClpB
LQRELETRIGRSLVAGDIPDGATITVALEEEHLAIAHEKPTATN